MSATGPGDGIADVDLQAVGVATIEVGPGVCLSDPSFVYAFAVATYERQVHADAPAAFRIDLDLDGDGAPDFAVYNRDRGGFSGLSDGRNHTYAIDLASGLESSFFAVDHRTNSATTVLLICAEQVGLTSSDIGTLVDVSVSAIDHRLSHAVRDTMTFPVVLGGERFVGIIGNQPYGAPIGAMEDVALGVFDFGAAGTNPTESGLLVRSIDGTAGTEVLVVPIDP